MKTAIVDLMTGPARIRGFGLEVSIGGGGLLRLLLDTGAKGILISQKAVDKAGLNHVGSAESWGIGDRGVHKTMTVLSRPIKPILPLFFISDTTSAFPQR